MDSKPGRRRSKRLSSTASDFNFTRGSKRTKTAPSPKALEKTEVAPSQSRSQEMTEDNADASNNSPRRPSKQRVGFSAKPAKPEPKVPSSKTDAHVSTMGEKNLSIKPKQRSMRLALHENGYSSDGEPADDDEEGQYATVLPPPPEPEAQSISCTTTMTITYATSTMIRLNDAPVLKRNKPLQQKKTRRSRLDLHGRRESSLLDSGHSATPHEAIPSHEFYKYIESSLPEPRRMRQLLTWCGERALGERPGIGEGTAAVLAARQIQEEVLKEFDSRSELSNWFARGLGEKRTVVVPNTVNVANAARVAELEERIKRLQKEKAELLALSPTLFTQPPQRQSAGPSIIDPTLLSPSSIHILSALHANTTLAPRITARLNSVRDRLELATDVFAHAVHGLEEDGKEMDAVTGRVMEGSQELLREREARERGGMGVRDVIRTLSGLGGRVVEGSGGGGNGDGIEGRGEEEGEG
ncbi:hypothetical protein V500_00466 [Pseudogymnoascus sp. VKM F-4518 (FW-2643)]|nr:hypothetical protein V500_00466 [Pseudogymnoascus sp. VKM F-4518 (FW-2643)]